MDDTSLDVYRLQVSIWQAKPFAERMRLGCAADAMGLQAAAAIVARDHPDDPAALFLALHGDSMGVVDRNRIASAIRSRHLALNPR